MFDTTHCSILKVANLRVLDEPSLSNYELIIFELGEPLPIYSKW